MKVLFGLLLVGAALFAALHYGGMFSYDPAAEAKQVRAAVDQPGASWTKVVAVQAPRKWCVWNETKKMVDGEELVTTKPGPEVPFDAKNLEQRLADGNLPAGFSFIYDFGGDRFAVKFDDAGNVEYVQDMKTMKDLLDNRG